MAACSPVMRTHERNRPDTNWQFDSDPETLRHLARMTRLFVALRRYHLEPGRQLAVLGLPPIRPLALHYPDDPGAGRHRQPAPVRAGPADGSRPASAAHHAARLPAGRAASTAAGIIASPHPSAAQPSRDAPCRDASGHGMIGARQTRTAKEHCSVASRCRRFEGKLALVTGGANGFGRATVHRLVDEGLEQVIIVDRDGAGAAAEVEKVKAHGGDGFAIECDVSDVAAVARIGRAVRIDRLHVLVNSAGIGGGDQGSSATSCPRGTRL